MWHASTKQFMKVALLSVVLTIFVRKKISIGFLSQARTAATVAEIRVFESFRSNSETGKECHARVDGRTVNGVDGHH